MNSPETRPVSTRSGAAMPLAAYALTRSWLERTRTGGGSADGVSWNQYDGSNNWANAGGDYSTPAANYGVIITTTATDNFTINMRESASNGPQLVLTY